MDSNNNHLTGIGIFLDRLLIILTINAKSRTIPIVVSTFQESRDTLQEILQDFRSTKAVPTQADRTTQVTSEATSEEDSNHPTIKVMVMHKDLVHTEQLKLLRRQLRRKTATLRSGLWLCTKTWCLRPGRFSAVSESRSVWPIRRRSATTRRSTLRSVRRWPTRRPTRRPTLRSFGSMGRPTKWSMGTLRSRRRSTRRRSTRLPGRRRSTRPQRSFRKK